MDSDIDIQTFINCTQLVLRRNRAWDGLNVTQLLDLLPSQLQEDVHLKETLGNCMGLGERPYSPPWWGQLAWLMIFAIMLLLAVLGNTLVIWIVLAHRRMRTVTNCFLVNLAIADLLMATLNGAPNFVFLIRGHSETSATQTEPESRACGASHGLVRERVACSAQSTLL
ncbi:hypothetical protein MSG28_008045 [Choristoneura fumiferana]|uniref:Uncharacterized protein n=1 Tax=Choristoneura fumiferana TaxID=7141 RepID=A0ACC0J9N9_CHOFU|nr:hypothetical protein MSG28_008045 [Choristoneura fumiferana]